MGVVQGQLARGNAGVVLTATDIFSRSSLVTGTRCNGQAEDMVITLT